MQNFVSKKLVVVTTDFLRFVLDPRSQVSRLGVFSMNEHAMLQLAVNTLGYDSDKMWSINNISSISVNALGHQMHQNLAKNNILEITLSPSSGSI